jgi:NhaP-type Na+/H+ or K+/H+ antiporter
MFVTGFAIFLGLVLILVKLPRRTMLRLLRYDVALDVAVTVIVLAVHWGTFSGIMAATIAGLLCSIGTTLAKRTFGYIKGDQYFPGIVTLRV